MSILMLPDFNKIAEDAIFRPCVQKGVAYLDEHHQGWWQKIVTEQLDMADGQACICGFVFEGYDNRPDELFDGALYGFNVPDNIRDLCPDDMPSDVAMFLENPVLFDCGRRGWSILEGLWLDEIYWRTSF